MALPFTEAEEDTFDINTDWLESIENSGPASTHFSLDAQECQISGIIPWNKQRSATRYFLGFAYSDPGTPWNLHRENPAIHPLFPWMRAASISFTPIAPQKNEDTGTAKIEAFLPGTDTIPYSSYYQKVLATITFRSYRMVFLEDIEIETNQDEWMRNVVFDLIPKIEAISADGVSQMYFNETSATGPPYSLGPPTVIKTPFPAPFPALKSLAGFVLTWTNVPYEYLSNDPNYFYPTKIINCAGCLNSDTFLGNLVPGTCLMQAPSFKIKPFPVPSDEAGVPLYAVDVTIQFDFFDPFNGASGSPYAGHTLFPWRGNNFWYHAVRDDNVSEILPSVPFNVIFENVNE